MDNKRNQSLFKPKSWSDLGVLMSLIGLLIGCIQWGLKLDDRQSDHQKRIGKIERSVEIGILPIADERYRTLRQQIIDLEKDLESHENRHPDP